MTSTPNIIYILASFLMFNFNVVQASVEPIIVSSNMPAKVQQEFNMQYQAGLKKYEDNFNALLSVTNPYERFTEDLNLGDKKLSKKEHELLAEEERFNHCHQALPLMYTFTSKAKNLTEGAGALTKDELMAGSAKHFELAYPFTAEDAKNFRLAPLQMALKKGWQHRGIRGQGVDDFFNSCLNIPLEIYMLDDEAFDDEDNAVLDELNEMFQ